MSNNSIIIKHIIMFSAIPMITQVPELFYWIALSEQGERKMSDKSLNKLKEDDRVRYLIHMKHMYGLDTHHRSLFFR